MLLKNIIIIGGLVYYGSKILIRKDVKNSNEIEKYIEEVKIQYPFTSILSTSLVMAVIQTESNFDMTAVSSADARGFMQIKPKTFKWIADIYSLPALDPFNGKENILVGMHYLAKQIKALGKDGGIQAYYTGLSGYKNGARNYTYLAKVLSNQLNWI